ncbi:MAG TPA: hypothetical protein VFB52_10720 [Solirubrobacterales bacterium]|nr:hypothetical protein [Solirubrobacterales bacterium]
MADIIEQAERSGYVDLYWLPLGAGGSVVRLNGRAYEALTAMLARRRPRDLYHAALTVDTGAGRFTIEIAPVPDADGAKRGAVAEGTVGSNLAGRLRVFRYELRCWPDGTIPDLAEAVESPVRLSDDAVTAARLVEQLPLVPMPVWGRDELGAGEMWTSNSTIAWLLCRAGIDAAAIALPHGGRAPGWDAGIAVAQRPGPEPVPAPR